MLLLFAIFIAIGVAISVFAVEYSDRLNQKRRQEEANYLRGQIAQAQQRHAPRKSLYRRLIELRRQELESNRG